jgi:hypothetical protein
MATLFITEALQIIAWNILAVRILQLSMGSKYAYAVWLSSDTFITQIIPNAFVKQEQNKN